MSAKSIVIFGETGAGKSSVVNLMAEKPVATTSPDMGRCTTHWEEHSITFDGHSYKVFDTVGLTHSSLGKDDCLNAIMNVHNLIEKLQREGGIDLLLFCMRAGGVTQATQSNYRLFYEWLCKKKVPIVLVVTGLDDEQRREKWWDENKHLFHKHDIRVVAHVCITAAAADKLGGTQSLGESRRAVRELVAKYSNGREGSAWYKSVVQRVWEFPQGNLRFTLKKKNTETILTQRCGIEPEIAKELAMKIGPDSPSLTSTRQTADEGK